MSKKSEPENPFLAIKFALDGIIEQSEVAAFLTDWAEWAEGDYWPEYLEWLED